MALTRAQLAALIAANLPNNVSKLITPAKHREVEDALTAAAVNVEDDIVVASAGAGDAGKIPALDGAGTLDPSVIPGGGGGAAWGAITGTLADQTDLQDALDSKVNTQDSVLEGAVQVNADDNGMAVTSEGVAVFNADSLGFQLSLPLIESVRDIGDLDSPIIDISDLVINGLRTDSEPLVLPSVGGASSGQNLSVAHKGTGPQPIDGDAAGEIYDGANGVVDSITLAVGETVLFKAVGTEWCVFARYLSAVPTSIPWEIQLACSDISTPITSGAKKAYFPFPFDGTLTEVFVNVDTAPTGSAAIFDLNKNGTTMLSTAITIDAGETSSLTAGTPPVISVTSFAKGDIGSIDFDQVGSTIAGLWVIATLRGTRAI